MAFIRYKQRGERWYVYQVSNIWDKTLKKYVQKSTYLGAASEKGGEYRKAAPQQQIELGVVDFGDTYAIKEITKSSNLLSIIEESIGNVDSIMTLISYQLTTGSAMYNCSDWADGNIASKLFPKAAISSQSISRLLAGLGKESVQRKFFKQYISAFFNNKHGILIDSTALPSTINASLNSWGYGASGIEQKVGCLMLVDKESKLPIFFRAIPGEVADISTLKTTINEIEALGLKTECAIFDAGYFSEENIKYLCDKKINFISRMPKSRSAFRTLIMDNQQLESPSNAVQYGKRIVFIRSEEIVLYEHRMYAHIILDPDKKAKDINILLSDHFANPNEEKPLEEAMKSCGYLILISKHAIPKNEVLPNYYTRQSIEQIFGFAKTNNLLPLRTHSNVAINGYLFLIFITSIIFIQLRNKLQSKFTVEQALIILRNLKAKVYENNIIPLEATKKAKDIFKLLDLTVPTTWGI